MARTKETARKNYEGGNRTATNRQLHADKLTAQKELRDEEKKKKRKKRKTKKNRKERKKSAERTKKTDRKRRYRHRPGTA